MKGWWWHRVGAGSQYVLDSMVYVALKWYLNKNKNKMDVFTKIQQLNLTLSEVTGLLSMLNSTKKA